MPDPIKRSKELITNGWYQQAYDILVKAKDDGYDKAECLTGLGLCKFSIAAYDKQGTGMFSGISRRTDLLVAREHLEETLQQNEIILYNVYLLCAVEYALGLLMDTKNGQTDRFLQHYSALEHFDKELTMKLVNELDDLDELFGS